MGVDIFYRDVGGYPLHETSPGGFPRLGGAATDGAGAMVGVGREVGVHIRKGGKRGGGV